MLYSLTLGLITNTTIKDVSARDYWWIWIILILIIVAALILFRRNLKIYARKARIKKYKKMSKKRSKK